MNNNDDIFSVAPTAQQLIDAGYCIDPKELQKFLSEPEFHQVLTGEYAGHYTVGVRKLDDDEIFIIRYQIEGDFEMRRDEIAYNEMKIIVQTESGFTPPKAMGSALASHSASPTQSD